MKAITIWQPHATLIALGLKPYETREWAHSYRGPIAIHAGSARKDFEALMDQVARCSRLGKAPERGTFLWTFLHVLKAYLDVHTENGAQDLGEVLRKGFPFGAIVATGELTAIYDAGKLYPKLKWPECDFGDFSPGRYAWRIENVKRLKEPIPVRGDKGLWEWNAV